MSETWTGPSWVLPEYAERLWFSCVPVPADDAPLAFVAGAHPYLGRVAADRPSESVDGSCSHLQRRTLFDGGLWAMRQVETRRDEMRLL